MDKKKIITIVAAACVVIAAAAIIFAAKNKQNDNANNNVSYSEASTANKTAEESGTKSEEQPKATDNGEEKKEEIVAESSENQTVEKVTPTFMYFISASDEEFEKTNKMLEELKKQYGDKVNFDIVNVDENPEAKKNFPVEGQTPALIMLNTSNDISALEFKCNDKSTLSKDIENALK